MSIYDRNESIITDKLSFVKSKREKNQKLSYQPSGKKMHAFKDTTEKFHGREGCHSLITLLPLRLFLK